MGIPYSRQINAAFDQVTPLVAQAYAVLDVTKNIAILLAVIQVVSVLLLAMILSALVAIIIAVTPDLEEERKTLVTPTIKAILHRGLYLPWLVGAAVLFGAIIGGLWFATRGTEVQVSEQNVANASEDGKT